MARLSESHIASSSSCHRWETPCTLRMRWLFRLTSFGHCVLFLLFDFLTCISTASNPIRVFFVCFVSLCCCCSFAFTRIFCCGHISDRRIAFQYSNSLCFFFFILSLAGMLLERTTHHYLLRGYWNLDWTIFNWSNLFLNSSGLAFCVRKAVCEENQKQFTVAWLCMALYCVQCAVKLGVNTSSTFSRSIYTYIYTILVCTGWAPGIIA